MDMSHNGKSNETCFNYAIEQLKPRVHSLDDGNIGEGETEEFEENDKESG